MSWMDGASSLPYPIPLFAWLLLTRNTTGSHGLHDLALVD